MIDKTKKSRVKGFGGAGESAAVEKVVFEQALEGVVFLLAAV